MNLLVVIADGWGYTHGGINVFNREMCKGFSHYLNLETHVVCVAPGISDEEISRVKQEEGVDLICVSEDEFKVPKVIFDKVNSYCEERFLFEDLLITWLGHDRYSDYQAIECKKMKPGSICAIIHHMSYSTYYPLVNADVKDSLEKEKTQRERLREADIVFANGPLLLKSAQDLRGGTENVFEILPGVYDVENIKTTYIPDTFYVVSFGRVELEVGTKRNNSIIKQIFLASAAWSKFTTTLRADQESVMKVYGKSKDDSDTDVYDLVKTYFKDLHSFTMIPYEENHDALLNDLTNYSLCLILSSKEGFGLTAIEAISAGIPIIVSKSSGFYQSLKKRALDGFVHAIDIEASLDEPYYTDNDLERTAKEIEEVYYDQENAKKKTLKLREELIKEGYTWENCARTILEKLDMLAENSVSDEINDAVSWARELEESDSWLEEMSNPNSWMEDVACASDEPVYTLAERFVLGYDIDVEMSKKEINEAYDEAHKYFLRHIEPFNFEQESCDEDLFQNINRFDASIRFLYAQYPYLNEYVVSDLELDILQAMRYGANWTGCVPSIFWVEEYKLSDKEESLVEDAKKLGKQLVDHTISECEISTYNIYALLRNGYLIDELIKMHFDLNQLVRFGVEKALLVGYYADKEIDNAFNMAENVFSLIDNVSLGKYEKFGPRYLAKKFDAKSVLEVFSIEEIYHAFDVADILCIEPMISARILKQGGYTAEELALNGFTNCQLIAAGYEITGVKFVPRNNGITDSNIIKDTIEDIIFDLEEEACEEELLCRSSNAELLKRLKRKGFRLSQIRRHLPFVIESCPLEIKWLLMANYTIEELEAEKIEWKEYFKYLPPDIIGNLYTYQYDGVPAIELLKSGVGIEGIKSIYGLGDYIKDYGEAKQGNVHFLRKQGYTARAFCEMGKSFAEVNEAYSVDDENDILELALSSYDLRELRRAGYPIGKLENQYELNLMQYDVEGSDDEYTRYGNILEFINKHGR